MPRTRSWDNTQPPGTQDLSLGSDRIREFRVDTDERFQVEHYNSTSLTVDGKHKKGSARINYGTDATRQAIVLDAGGSDQGSLFLTTDTGRWFYVNDTNAWIDTGLRQSRRVLVVVNRGSVVAGTSPSFISTKIHLYAPTNGTLSKISIMMDTAPTVQPLLIDVRRAASIAGALGVPGTETSVFTLAGRFAQVNAGSKTGQLVFNPNAPQSDTVTVTANDAFVLQLAQVAGGTAGGDFMAALEYLENA